MEDDQPVEITMARSGKLGIFSRDWTISELRVDFRDVLTLPFFARKLFDDGHKQGSVVNHE